MVCRWYRLVPQGALVSYMIFGPFFCLLSLMWAGYMWYLAALDFTPEWKRHLAQKNGVVDATTTADSGNDSDESGSMSSETPLASQQALPLCSRRDYARNRSDSFVGLAKLLYRFL